MWVRLGEICKIARGGSPRPIKSFITESNDGINWIKISDSDNGGKYINQTKEKITADGVKSSRKVYAGDLLLTNSMSFGRPYILNTDGCIHDGWLVISDIFSIFDKEFLFYSLLSQASFLQFCKAVGGSVVKNLNSDKVASIFLPLPPPSEQKRIVDKLEEILPLVEKYKENKEKLDELNLNFPSKLKKSILDYAIKGKLVEQNLEDESVEILLQKIIQEKQRLVKVKKLKADKFPQSTIFIGEDNSPYEKIGKETRCIEDKIPFEIPSSWAWVRLGEIAKSLSAGGDKPADFSKYKTILKNIPVVANGEYNDGILGYTAEAKIKEASITISGRGTIGFSIVRDYPYFPIVRLLSFSPYKPINIKYINYGLNTLLEVGVGTSIKQLTIPMLAEKLLPLPPLPEQKRIVTKIEELLKFVDILQSSLK